MPELPELLLFERNISSWCKGKTFSPKNAYSAEAEGSSPVRDAVRSDPFLVYTVLASVRGKEFRLDLRANHGDKVLHILFTHGLVGQWKTYEGEFDESLFTKWRFRMGADQGGGIVFVDQMRMGRFKIGDFSGKRGPCPVAEPVQFKANILENLGRTLFSKQIYQIMLDQTFFNGIGNYLRSEILHRAGLSPFIVARKLFTDADLQQRFFDTTFRTIGEVVERGLNKYGTPEERKQFSDWLQCYENPGAQRKRDDGGRTLFYFSTPGNASSPPGEGATTAAAKKPSALVSPFLVGPSKGEKKAVTFSSPSPPSPAAPEETPQFAGFLEGGAAAGPTAAPSVQAGAGVKVPMKHVPGEVQPRKDGKPVASDRAKIIVLVNNMCKEGLLTVGEKQTIKKIVFDQQPENEPVRGALYGVLDALQADADKDYADVGETLRCILCHCHFSLPGTM